MDVFASRCPSLRKNATSKFNPTMPLESLIALSWLSVKFLACGHKA